jgi:2-polyprenyl-6-methoxyphenol hydroxylase-like FAD-dependent oxidoreductase
VARKGPDTWWPTPEPPHRINQLFLEPATVRHAAAMPHVTILNRIRVVDFDQTDSEVRATAERLDDGSVLQIRARYLVGCDGAHSNIRHIMGIRFSGDAAVMQTQSTYIRAPRLLGMMPKPAWLSVSLNHCSTYIACTSCLAYPCSWALRNCPSA